MKTQFFQRTLATACFIALTAASPTLAGPSDGTVIGATKIVDHGPNNQRFNIVLIAEGYQLAELNQFAQDAQHYVDVFFQTPPFNTNCSIFNIWRIDVASTDSGADDPAMCGDGSTGSGAMPATYFDAKFCGDGNIRRLLTASTATATTVLNAQVPDWDSAVVVVNSTQYGGSGGQIAVTSISGTDWPQVAIHEFGHSAFALADEYEYYAGCGVDAAGTRDHHPAAEPAAANVTVQTNPLLVKWRSLFFPGITIPTTSNADCTQCDPQGDPFPGGPRVGLYEGADYFHCDAFRPVFNCKFRVLSADFCPVCIQRMLQVLAAFAPANSAPVCDAGGPYVAECTGASTSVTLDGRASSDPDCNALTYAWTGPFAGGTAAGPTPTVQFSGIGLFTVNLTVSDGQAPTTCSVSVTVRDTTPPTITCPANIVVCNDPGKCSAVVNYPAPTVTDNCQGGITIVCSPPFGSVFPKGTTIVTCTAADVVGNTSSCTFTVTVKDCEAPLVDCRPTTNPAGTTIPKAGKNPSSGQNPDGFYQLLATDNCDPTASLQIFVKDSAPGPCGGTFAAGPYAPGTKVKLTQSTGKAGVKPMAGVIVAHIQTKGDPVLVVTDSSGNTTCHLCLLPRPPK